MQVVEVCMSSMHPGFVIYQHILNTFVFYFILIYFSFTYKSNTNLYFCFLSKSTKLIYHFTQSNGSLFINSYCFISFSASHRLVIYIDIFRIRLFSFGMIFELQFLWRGEALMLRNLKPMARLSGAQLISLSAAKESLWRQNWRIHFYSLCIIG